MLPKAEYMKLSKADKAALKRKLGMGSAAPRKRVYKKRAPKTTFLGKVGRAAGAYIPYVPSSIGAEVGEYLGNKASQGIASVFGHGDYVVSRFSVKDNTLLTPGDSPPQFGTTGRITRVKHREYIGDIFSSSSFALTQYSINPGLTGTFPWLASVASNYECYRLKGMLFEFKSMSSDALNSTNTALGSVIMATQYNAADSPFISKQQMENYEFAQSCKPSQCMLHYIECARNSNPLTELYVRSGSVPQGQSPQLYDIGSFQIATQGMQATNVNLGELWVTYDVELLKPKLVQGQYGDSIYYYHGYIGSGASSSNYFSGIVTAPASNLNILTGSATITFPSNIIAGNYAITYQILGTSGTCVTPSITLNSGCIALDILSGGGSQVYGVETGRLAITQYVTITGNAAQLTLSGATMPSGVLGGDLIITQINGLAD